MFDFLKRKKYGLALGAGGAKGLIHIGVIKALEELNIKITHIGGTSIGSLVGGMYALWGDVSKIEDIFLNFDKKDLGKMLRSDISLTQGIFKGKAILEEIGKHFGDATFADCKIPFVAITVDLLTGEKIYHTEGLLKNAARASCSVPLVFKPYEMNGRFLIDGGVAECVPVKATKSIGAKKVIAVNIQGFPTEKEKLNFKNLSMRIYKACMYHIAKRDTELADKKLFIDLSDRKTEELIENAKEYIQMGYDRTIELFS